MIRLMFEKNGSYFVITIDNKVITYHDKLQGKLWGTSLQYLPQDPNNIKKILHSRNRIPKQYIDFLKVDKEELKEFNDAKDDNELRILVLRDTMRNGCRLIE